MDGGRVPALRAEAGISTGPDHGSAAGAKFIPEPKVHAMEMRCYLRIRLRGGRRVQGRPGSQPARTYGLDARTWDSIFFNNYGVRSVCPDAGCISWNWLAPFKLAFNTIQVNGRTCITLASFVLGPETCERFEIRWRGRFAISWTSRRARPSPKPG